VTITGTNFNGPIGVTIGGAAVPSLVVVNQTTITCTTPAGTAGTASVLVTTPSGTNAPNTLFTYFATPAVTGINPSSGSTAGGTGVTITGTNFTGATGVTIGGAAATNVSVVNASTITCTTPAGNAGAASVRVTTPGGTNAANTLFTYTSAGPLAALDAYLKASNTGEDDRFGYSVAISGDTAVVGAPLEDSNATTIGGNGADNSVSNAGAAYVFIRSGGTWSQQAYLKASNSGANDSFGISVAVSGDTIVVGAHGEASNATGVGGNGADNSAPSAGAVYVYTRSGGTWTQQAYLKASNTGAGDFFGYSVAVSGETAVIGAYTEDSNATGVAGNGADNSASSAGAAYVFTRSGGTWTQQAYLKASNTGAGDQFGSSVAISSDTVIVGALNEDSNATGVDGNGADNSTSDAGAAYVFTRSGGIWSQQAYLKASNTGASDNFGNSVAMSGDTVVIGASFESSNATGVGGNGSDNSASFSGAAYVFTRSSGTWSQQAYLKASNTGEGDFFGHSVAVSGDSVVIGAKSESSNATGVGGDGSNNSASNSGAAYAFSRSGGTWTQQAYLKASNTEAADSFGLSVALDGDKAVIGAWGEDSNATGVGGNGSNNSMLSAGSAYTFTGLGPMVVAPTLTSITPTSGSTLGGTSVTLTGTNFTGATGVTIGGASATNVSVVNASTITCTTPVGTAGAKSVIVTTPAGQNVANSLFTYLSSNADLASMTFSSGALSPLFAPGTTSYAITVPQSVTSLTFSATKADSSASLYATASPLALNLGDNELTFNVVAADGVTSKFYRVSVMRNPEGTSIGYGTVAGGVALPDHAVVHRNTSSQALVDGFPAIAYMVGSDFDRDLKFVRALDASGTTWGAPVTVASGSGNQGEACSLLVVDGFPAICYMDNSTSTGMAGLKFVRAQNAAGTVWGMPTGVTTGEVTATSLAIVGGHPAIGFVRGDDLSVRYVRSMLSDGGHWPSSVTIGASSGGTAPYISLAVVNGRPAMGYVHQDTLRYSRASDANGEFFWEAPVNLGSAFVRSVQLIVADGKPGLCYSDDSFGLKYRRAEDASGTAWGAALTLDSSYGCGTFSSMAIIGGLPTISYWIDSNRTDLKLVRAQDAGGTLWGDPSRWMPRATLVFPPPSSISVVVLASATSPAMNSISRPPTCAMRSSPFPRLKSRSLAMPPRSRMAIPRPGRRTTPTLAAWMPPAARSCAPSPSKTPAQGRSASPAAPWWPSAALRQRISPSRPCLRPAWLRAAVQASRSPSTPQPPVPAPPR
jgi:hypothetical protein